MINLLDEKYKLKIRYLIEEIPKVIDKFNKWGYRKNLDFYLYRLIISKIRTKELKSIFKHDEVNKFIALVYSTLISWDMDKRQAKIKQFDEVRENILENQSLFLKLSTYRIKEVDSQELFLKIKELVKELYKNLNLMKGESRLVSNSKIMHFFLPELILPMDGKNTLKFFSTYENPKKSDVFLKIFESSWRIAQTLNLEKYIDNKWNASIPKIIDNAIIYIMYQNDYEINRINLSITKIKNRIEKKGVSNSIATQLKKDLKSIFQDYRLKL